jgi:hypothetical protein
VRVHHGPFRLQLMPQKSRNAEASHSKFNSMTLPPSDKTNS